MKANDLRPGNAINLDGQLWIVVKTEHVKPGKGPAYVQAKIKNVVTGANLEKRLNSFDVVEDVNLDRREMEYLFTDSTGATFMDLEDFDQVVLNADLLGDAMLYLRPNSQIVVLFHGANPISIELPAAVDLVVTDTPPGIKGATATNQLKEAECETGLKTKVPPFITNGETIRVSTEDGSYQSRVKTDA